MYGEVILMKSNGDSEICHLLANGTTSMRYKNVFGEELMEALTSIISSLSTMGDMSNVSEDNLQNISKNEFNGIVKLMANPYFDSISKLAYIMNAAADGKDMNKLTFVKYVNWLETFETMEFIFKAGDIISVYMGNRMGTVSPKKDNDPLTGR